MEEKFVLTEVNVNEDAIGDMAFEVRTAKVKGLVAGATLVGACWLAVGLYKKYKVRNVRKSEQTKESEEDLID